MLSNMNNTPGGPKKASICRYYLNSGTCFYGDECQFMHSTSCNDVAALPRQDRPDSESPCMEPNLFHPFASTGLPPESKLQSYINASPRTINSGIEKPTHYILPSESDVTSTMSSLNVDNSRKTPVTGIDFMPLSVNSSRLTHSISSPSFTHYSSVSSNAGSTPFGRFGTDHSQTLGLINNHSQVTSPNVSPEHSPLSTRRNVSPQDPSFQSSKSISSSSSGISSGSSTSKHNDLYGVSFNSMFQESFAGTTYFYASEDNNAESSSSPVILPDYRTYPGNPSHVEHMKPKANAPSFFLPDELRMDLLHRLSLTLAQPNPDQNPDCPSDVDNYHNICPLEAVPPGGLTKSTTFGFVTSVYKATNVKTGVYYCLRRIHGFRLSNTKCMQVVDIWKKLQHSNLVHLREVFTTKAFSDHSMIFVYDYHAGADTLMNQYFGHVTIPAVNGYTQSAVFNHSESQVFNQNKSLSNLRQHAGLHPESLIWAYIVQLSSALRTIHAAGLACRALDPTKILITGKSRLRLNCCGIFDVLGYDASQQNKTLTAHFQQEDLLAFGKVVLALACNSLAAVQRENLQSSLELVARSYSADLRNLILYLLSNQTRNRNINDIMPMIGARFYTQLDAAQLRSDVIENELAKEVENGRLFRLMVKLGCINERPEFNMDPSWSETGDRYLLKLFRDYLFHQVTEDGRPWLDLAHVVQCFNKLDAGISEKICLMSRDEQNVLVVSYAELKQYLEASFGEILSASATPKSHQPS